jgi:uncharacterized membrane protein YkvA (DUF1232 family)
MNQLTDYLNYVSNEGINLGRFVERGGDLVGQQKVADLTSAFATLREKIETLPDTHRLLGQQLAFLADVLTSERESLPVAMRNEATFALLYAVAEVDLMPDQMPEVGYLDDQAVTEIVLSRHAKVFERYCQDHKMEWAAVKPISQTEYSTPH